MTRKTITPFSWDEFLNSKLLWMVNRLLHIYGVAIVVDVEDGVVKSAYPARVTFRGFAEEADDEGFKGLYEWTKKELPLMDPDPDQVPPAEELSVRDQQRAIEKYLRDGWVLRQKRDHHWFRYQLKADGSGVELVEEV